MTDPTKMPTPEIKAAIEALKPIFDELEKAVRKFPTWPTDPLHALAVLGEEYGELTKEVLQLVYEPHKASLDEIRKEAKQTAAMALRFYLSLDQYAYAPQAQHEQPALRADLARTPAQAVDVEEIYKLSEEYRRNGYPLTDGSTAAYDKQLVDHMIASGYRITKEGE